MERTGRQRRMRMLMTNTHSDIRYPVSADESPYEGLCFTPVTERTLLVIR